MRVIETIRQTVLSPESEPAAAPRSAACLNCGTPLVGPYCAVCGQRDIPPYPSVKELVVDAFWELSGWDGRFAATARALLRRPGMLTLEFLEGRRARYISPLRLYLLASLVYFVLAAAAPAVRVAGREVQSFQVTVGSTTTGGRTGTSAPQRVADETRTALESQRALTAEQREAAMKDIARAPAVMRPFLRHAIEDPAGLRRSVLDAMPRMLFALLPVFAAIVALFYRHRKYPEHLYFAIHLNAFVFLALSAGVLARFTRLTPLVTAVGFVVLAAIPIYATKAFRRVYGGSLALTLAKEVAIVAIYGVVSMIAFLVMLYVVSMTG